ncbi:MAG: acyltransferase family protein [Victivallales bacterium]|nr:acyltransferase family protein [Victivallales bacterium]
MIFCINFLRCLAACLITNAHYTGIYPTDLIANGGLLGDVLFFAVSGYCLANVKYPLSAKGFLQWYGKRIWRIYPVVVIATAIFMLLGYYSLAEHKLVWWYVYPTCYHFIASILVLYIPFFFVMRIDALQRYLLWVMFFTMIVWLALYFFIYDKSYYHIDVVREPMIRFLFLESLFLGAWFRLNDSTLRNRFVPWHCLLVGGLLVVYFASKLLFVRHASLATWQFLNQLALFALLFFVFRIFIGLDEKMEHLPHSIKVGINFISQVTLEIYVVQYVLIGVVRDFGLPFPVNWIALTAIILIAASLLHELSHLIHVGGNWLADKLSHKHF